MFRRFLIQVFLLILSKIQVNNFIKVKYFLHFAVRDGALNKE